MAFVGFLVLFACSMIGNEWMVVFSVVHALAQVTKIMLEQFIGFVAAHFQLSSKE